MQVNVRARMMHPISLVSDADFKDSADVDGEKHSQSKHHRRFHRGDLVRQYNFLRGPCIPLTQQTDIHLIWTLHAHGLYLIVKGVRSKNIIIHYSFLLFIQLQCSFF